MSPSEGSSRRRFLKTSAALCGLATVPAAAATEGRKSGAEAGINSALESLTRQGRFEQAAKLAQRHGVEYGHSRSPLPSFGGGDVGTQDAFSNSDSSINAYYWYKRDDSEGQEIYDANIYASITEHDCQVVDDAAPKDAVALYWSDDQFQGVSESKSNYNEIGSDTDIQSYENYLRYGVWAKVKDNAIQDSSVACDGNSETFSCGISTEIEKLEYGNSFNVTGEYLHNWNPGGVYYVSSFNLGPVGLNFGGSNVYDWRKEETMQI